jgi:hypothetical protein
MKALFLILLFQTAQPADPKLETLAADLRALARVTALSQELERNRQVLLAIADDDIKSLREARADGTYRWASLQREEASRVKDEKAIEQVHTETNLRNVTVTASNAYRVDVTAPKKRGVLAENNRVFVRNVIVESTGFDGKVTHREIPVSSWVNPGDTNSVALPDIGKSVTATVELGVESGNKKAVAEVALVQAKLVDDPQSPYFPAVKRLHLIREALAEGEINRGRVKSAVDEALLALPGELEKRAEDQKRMLEARAKATEIMGAGDVSPGVLSTLNEIARLLDGNAGEQAQARTRLAELIARLSPKPHAHDHAH